MTRGLTGAGSNSVVTNLARQLAEASNTGANNSQEQILRHLTQLAASPIGSGGRGGQGNLNASTLQSIHTQILKQELVSLTKNFEENFYNLKHLAATPRETAQGARGCGADTSNGTVEIATTTAGRGEAAAAATTAATTSPTEQLTKWTGRPDPTAHTIPT